MSHYTVAVFTEDGQDIYDLLSPFSEYLEVEPYVYDTKENILKGIEERCKHDLELKNKYLDMSDEDKIRAWTGYDKFDSDGNPLTTYNPNSKWDWYEIGGRWSDSLKTKDGEYVDSCLVKDLDLSPDSDAYDEASRFWEIVVEDSPLKEDEVEPFNLYSKEYFIERYGNKENYAKIQSSMITYAVLTPDGEWHEPGQMGWWGITGATTNDEKSWDESYMKFLEEANPDWTITIVDCHI